VIVRDTRSDEITRPTRGWWLALGAILVVAACLRLCNLGTFSLWLDEIFTMTRSVLTMPELLAAAAADADNVPLYLIVTHVCIGVGMAEPWLRLVPILAGLASILLWAQWSHIHFGARISLLTAGFMALSTFHVRYSQELRAYPYLLLVTGLAMLAADRLRTRPTRSAALILAAMIGVGWYTHLSFAMFLVPMVGLVLFTDDPALPGSVRRRKTAPYLAASIVLGTLAFLPWFVIIAATLRSRMSRGATIWTGSVLGRRWEFLTVAANEADLLSWVGVGLAVLGAVGLLVAARHRIGRAVLIPAASMVVLSEVLYQIVNRWSKARYLTAVWPFLVILMILGLERVMRPVRSPWVRATVYGTIAVVLLLQVDAYHRMGRPHWDRMAAAVEEVRRPGELLLTESEWVSNGVGFFLDGPVASLRWETAPIHAALESHPSVLLVTTSQTGFLRRLRPDMVQPFTPGGSTGWPQPATELVSPWLEAPLPGCASRLLLGRSGSNTTGPSPNRIDLGRSPNKLLRSGWSPPKTRWDGTTVRWNVGLEAGVAVVRTGFGSTSIHIRLRPTPDIGADQELRALLNGQDLGAKPLQQSWVTFRFETRESVWKPGRNLLVLQFEKPRAAVVEWIDVTSSSF